MLYIIENAVDSGGNRVIYQYIRDSNCAVAGYILRRFTRLKDILGFLKDVISVNLMYKKLYGSKLLIMPALSKDYRAIVTTGRRCLEFIDDLSSPNHIHLMQHIEAWRSLNSLNYFEYCKTLGYPTGEDTIKFIISQNHADEIEYINNLKKITQFQTVSTFLSDIIKHINPSAVVSVSEPPEISYPIIKFGKVKPLSQRKYDLLIVLRGLNFKGDDIGLALLKSDELKHLKKFVILSTKKAARMYRNQLGNVEHDCYPDDFHFATILNDSKIVVNSSVSEGYGAVPREAIKYGCLCVTSNTGWIINSIQSEDIYIVYSHIPQNYISQILRSYNDIRK